MMVTKLYNKITTQLPRYIMLNIHAQKQNKKSDLNILAAQCELDRLAL